MNEAKTASPDDPVRKSIRPALILAWALLAVLPACLAVEELIRARFSPFLGFAGLGDRLSVRYAFYLGAAAAVVLIRVLNAIALRRKKTASPEAFLGRLKTVALLTLALAETPALLGLALFLVGGYNVDFYGLLFVSLILLFMYFPRIRTWEAHLQNAPPSCPF
jgi:hypothetical protein